MNDDDGQLTGDRKNSLQHDLAYKVLDARSEGLSRNATARLLGVSTYQVDKISREQGISWGGEHVAIANHARAEQAKAKRGELAEKFRKVAELELQAILEGQDTVRDRKDRATIAGIATDKDLAIAAHLGDTGDAADRDEAKEYLQRFMAGTKAAALSRGRDPDEND